jgi:hypothetical protein
MSCWYKIILIPGIVLLVGCTETTVERLPNIILIQADDLGWDDLGIHGNRIINTPNLDSLAGASVRFNQFYVTPVCATTRASLLTGRHFLRTGVSHVHGGKDFLHLDETTIAEVLKKAGYVTGMWGKWHSGKTDGYFPWERGFDEAFMARLYDHYDNVGMRNGQTLETSGWTTEVLTDMAIGFMKANREVPFFAYLSYLSCHAPLDAPDDLIDQYRGKGLSENLATLYSMVEQMDHHIGRLLDSLGGLGLTEHSVIFFLSDNGPAILNGRLTDEDRAIRYVNGLKGHKGNIWDNGIKSPLFVSYHGHFRPATVNRLVDVTDIFPTIATLAACRQHTDSLSIDGRCILPYLRDSAASLPSKEFFLYANPGWPPTDIPWTPEGVKDEYRPWKYSDRGELEFQNQIIGLRSERYKLLYHPGPVIRGAEPDAEGYVLIDMEKDPRETENLSAASAPLLKEMQRHLRYWHVSLFKDKHSFEMPVFQVTGDSSAASDVLAYAPFQVGPEVHNAANYITGFFTRDDYARYHVRVLREGRYDIRVTYDLAGPRPVQMAFNPGGKARRVTFYPGRKSVEIENITLPPGGRDWEITPVAGQNRLKLYRFTCSYRGP